MLEFLKKYKSSIYAFVLLTVLYFGYQYRDKQNKALKTKMQSSFKALQGSTMGTTYSIKFIDSTQNVSQKAIDSLLTEFSNSVSTYIPESEISEFNKTGKLKFRTNYFKTVLFKSAEIFEQTDGSFDPTVMPLVNAYGFGFAKKADSVNVDSLMAFVGFEKVQFNSDSVWTTVQGVQLDFSAIAKGYGVDIVCEYLKSKNINDFMVEIGGEVRCSGLSINKKPWVIGIENPMQNKEGQSRIQEKVPLSNLAMATSGNYRNYYEKNGQVFSHTINPKTGKMERNDLLSVSIIAPDCMTADAYATACMVMGTKKAIELSTKIKPITVYFISSEGEKISIYSTLNK